MGFIQEFKKFALRGNVVDMAVGIVIGAAFGKIVSSLVANIIMPPIGLLLGNLDFSDYKLVLSEGTPPDTPAVTVDYGLFLTTILDFVILAFAIFMLVRWMNRLTRKADEAPAAPTTRDCPRCLSTIPLKATRCAHCTSELTAVA